MRLHDFEKAIQKYVPNFHIMQAGYGDVAGCFVGRNYILRLNKGDIPLYSYSIKRPTGKYEYTKGALHPTPEYRNEKHRGRMQALNLLVNYRHLTQQQAQEIMWGVRHG